MGKAAILVRSERGRKNRLHSRAEASRASGASSAAKTGLLPFGKPGLTEIRGFRLDTVTFDDLRVPGNDEEGRQLRRHRVRHSRAKATQVELVELASLGQARQADAERELGCMVFSQDARLVDFRRYTNSCCLAVIAGQKQNYCRTEDET
jgi:hypothetical protein